MQSKEKNWVIFEETLPRSGDFSESAVSLGTDRSEIGPYLVAASAHADRSEIGPYLGSDSEAHRAASRVPTANSTSPTHLRGRAISP